MGRVGRQLTDAIKAATGERIVAFGRVGKPPENPIFDHSKALRAIGTPENYGIPQRLLKQRGVGQ